MRKLILIIALFFVSMWNSSIACDGLNVTVTSNSYIGNGEYLITVEICEFVSNSETLNGAVVDWASIYGIILTVNGANIIGINTPSITGVSSGLTIYPTQTAPNQVEYGDWGNSNAPVFLDYGDPMECWTIELIVDGPSTSVDVWSSSSESATQPGAGMTLNGGIWGCGQGVAVPAITCSSNWTPPTICVGSTTPIDLNATTAGTGVFTGNGVDPATGIFDPTGITSNVSVTFTVSNGPVNCSTTQDINFVNLNPPTLVDQTICAGDAVNLDATVSVPAGCTYTVVLEDNFGDGWNGADLDVYINGVLYILDQTVPNCGSAPCQVTLSIPVNDGDVILFNYSGGSWDIENTIFLYNSQGTLVSSINDPPNGNLGNGTIANCDPAIINYSWSPAAGLDDPSSPTPIATPGATTTYTVDISSPSLPCTAQASVTITVDPCSCTPPILILDDQTLCSPNTVDLSNTINPGSGSGVATFYNTAVDANAATNSIAAVVAISGTYYVRYEDPVDPTCYSVEAVNITIFPIYNMIENVVVCENNAVTYPDGVVEVITNSTSHISNLTTINGCDSTVTTNVAMNPLYSSVVDLTLCTGSNYTYPDGTTSTNITVNESQTSTLNSVAGCDSVIITNIVVSNAFASSENVNICPGEDHTYPDGTLSTNILVNESHVSLFISVLGCDSLVTTNVNVLPEYNFTENVSVCENETVFFPDGSSQMITNSTSYTSNLIAAGGCDSTIITNVTMYPNYTSVENLIVCENDNVIYPDGTTEIITSSVSYTSNLVSVYGCDSIIVTNVNMNPNYSSNEAFTICSGEDYTFPDGFTMTNITSNQNYTSNFNTVNGCDSVIITDITVVPSPPAFAGNDITVCDGESVVLAANDLGGNTVVWSGGVIDGQQFVPTSSGVYTVTITNATGCVSTDDVLVTVNPIPEPLFEGDDLSGCAPHTVNFTNLTAGNSNQCIWSFGNGQSSSDCGPVQVIYENTGTYTVSLTVTNEFGCTESITFPDYIYVAPEPNASFTAEDYTLDLFDTQVNFDNNSTGADSYSWDFGDGSDYSFDVNPIHTYPSNVADYTVTLIASNSYGCSDTASLVISIEDVIIYYVPNTFTPDHDEYNNTFIPIFTSGYDPQNYHLSIYNRWGEILFESFDVNHGWDGTYNGELMQDGSYVWVISFKETMTDKHHKVNGHVNILR